jgi:hypothetical protein
MSEERQPMPVPELPPANNLVVTGDEARYLIQAMTECSVPIPFGAGLNLFMRFKEISDVQPPTTRDESQ